MYGVGLVSLFARVFDRCIYDRSFNGPEIETELKIEVILLCFCDTVWFDPGLQLDSIYTVSMWIRYNIRRNSYYLEPLLRFTGSTWFEEPSMVGGRTLLIS